MDWSLAEELTKKTQEEIEKIEKVHILVVGKTGVGKSTLINNIFRERLAETGIGQPITKHLHKIEKEGVPMVLYDTRGLELDAETQNQVTSEIDRTLEGMVKMQQHMHVAYYCINASSSRIEDMEIRLIEYLANKMPVILVLTQSIGDQALKFEQYLVNQNLSVQAIIRLMAQDYKITDATVLVPMQIGMMAHITAIFGISMDRATALGILGAIGGTGSATYLGRLIVSNVAKFIPGIGSVAGGMISGITASIITTALAMSYIEVLTFIATAEANGEEVSPRTVRKLMKDLYGQRLKRGRNDPDFQAAMADIEAKRGQDAEGTKEKDNSQGVSLDDEVEEGGQKTRINWPKWSFRNRKR